jgi:HEAT repeat protein
MADGRVAFITGGDIVVANPGSAQRDWKHVAVEAGDVAAMPDGRLICTVPRKTPFAKVVKKQKRISQQFSYEKIAVVEPDAKDSRPKIIFDSTDAPLHSPVFLGPRQRPPLLAQRVDEKTADDVHATGVFFCQDARFTKNTTAGWPHVRAIRVLAGQGLTMRSSHSYIVHAGSEVTELGTVPLAADGSFAVEVPADTAIAFQAVDGEGRSELNEMSWIFVRPGEKRGCVGCHQPRQNSSPCTAKLIEACKTAPLKLLGQGHPHRFRGNNAAVTGEMELQFDRYRENAGINRHADTTEALATGAQEVAALIEQLKSSDENMIVSAAQRLAIFRDHSAAPALAAILHAQNRETRVAAAFALAACGTRDSVPPLLVALNDTDPLVEQAAAIALENLTGHTEPFDAFVSSETSGQQAVESWRAWFAKTSWDGVERGLIGKLASTNRDDVRRAAVALGHVGGDAARDALRNFVARDSQNNLLPEWRKHHQGDGARFNSLEPMNPRTIQAATRSLGYLRDASAISMLAETLKKNGEPANGNLFLAEAAAEALGRIATPEADAVLVEAFKRLGAYQNYSGWYGDHSALIACHASPVHYLIAEALDAMGSTNCSTIVPHLIQSVPTDPDRALLPANDDYETIIGRIIRRNGSASRVVETCLANLGDASAAKDEEIAKAISVVHGAWGGTPGPEIRSAQILSLTCRDAKFEPRVRAAFERCRDLTNDIKRVFDTGIPVVNKMPVKHWTSFFLARTLGNVASSQSFDTLRAALEKYPAEAATGRPDPLGPGNLFIHNDLTPCWRAESAWALGRIGDRRAMPVLTSIVSDFENAPDTRHAAAVALANMGDAKTLAALAANYPDIATRKTLLRGAASNPP